MGRIVVVGDRHQCQPAGTKVYLADFRETNIENIQVFDLVVSYNHRTNQFVHTNMVTQTRSRMYDGNMYTVKADGFSTKCTYNHKWLVQYSAQEEWNVVFLLKKKSEYRVGMCSFYNTKGNFSLPQLISNNEAECAWVLDVYANKGEACRVLDDIQDVYGFHNDSYLEMKDLLDSFNRHHDFPFCYHMEDQVPEVVQACNLLPNMMVPVCHGTTEVKWMRLSVEVQKATCEIVYSLNVENDHNYVADGILTKNSIYGFRGADITAIPSLVEMMEGRSNGCRVFPLSVCRRAPKSHIRLAQSLVPDIQWMTKENSGTEAPEGEIYQVSANVAYDMMREGDMAVSRVNKVLIPAAYQLIRMRKKVIIRGRDIGTGLISLIKKMKAGSVEELLRKMEIWFEKEVKKLCAKEGVSDPSMLQKGATKYQNIEDKVGCIEALCDGVDTLDELISTIEKLFSDFDDSGKPKQAIVLGTVHRTKGLEAYNVTMLDPEHFPHPLAKKSWERVQESNLAYVAATRAKFSLSKEGSVIEPGRLIFIGSCPSIYKANWLAGMSKYPAE